MTFALAAAVPLPPYFSLNYKKTSSSLHSLSLKALNTKQYKEKSCPDFFNFLFGHSPPLVLEVHC